MNIVCVWGNVMILNPVERYIESKAKQEGIEEGKREGIRESKLEIAFNLLNNGHVIDEVVKITGLSEEDILNVM